MHVYMKKNCQYIHCIFAEQCSLIDYYTSISIIGRMEVSRRGTPPPSSVVAPLIAAPVFSSVPPVAPTAPWSGIGGWTRGALYWAHLSMATAKHLNVPRWGVERTACQR